MAFFFLVVDLLLIQYYSYAGLQLGGLSDLMCVCVSSCLSDLSGGLQREDWKLLQTRRVCVSIRRIIISYGALK